MTDKQKMIWELLLSLNAGNVGFSETRVETAIHQYQEFEKLVLNDGESTNIAE